MNNFFGRIIERTIVVRPPAPPAPPTYPGYQPRQQQPQSAPDFDGIGASIPFWICAILLGLFLLWVAYMLCHTWFGIGLGVFALWLVAAVICQAVLVIANGGW